jgi:hypothetical protein
LFLGFYLHVAVERLRKRSTWSDSTTERASSKNHPRGAFNINGGPSDSYYINLKDCDFCSRSDDGKGKSCSSGGKEKMKKRRREWPGLRGDTGWVVDRVEVAGILDFDGLRSVEIIPAPKCEVKEGGDGNMIGARMLKEKSLFGKF